MREVDSYYPGWLEDHIEKTGGEVSKSQTPFQHKMNIDPGQRRQLPQFPDQKLTEKRMQEKSHQYDHETHFAKIVDPKLKKTAGLEEANGLQERLQKEVEISSKT